MKTESFWIFHVLHWLHVFMLKSVGRQDQGGFWGLWSAEGVIAVVGLGFYFILSLTGPSYLVFDERLHVPTVALLQEKGWTVSFLRAMPASPGPLFALVHLMFKPLVGLAPPGVRVVNFILFLGIVPLMRFLIPASDARSILIDMMGCPMLSVLLGLALTEIPAMFFLLLGLALLLGGAHEGGMREMRSARSRVAGDVGRTVAAGICLGLAILGRQNYVLIFAAFPCLVRVVNVRRLILSFVVAGAVFGPVFLIWHGMVPPMMQSNVRAVHPGYAVIAFAYAGFIALFVAPRFFVLPLRGYGAALLLAVPFMAARAVHYSSFNSIASRWPASWQAWWPSFCGDVLSLAASITVVAWLAALWRYRTNALFCFSAVSCGIFFLGCTVMGSMFSTRYTTAILPFWLVVLFPFRDAGWWKAGRLGLAVLVGGVSLRGYLAGN